ncbi:hypothetical protein J4219_01495 [Candidatus Woesearchaeota archaeon]|nr:hypothetical protein [Candidatus Woesearchaeota archaeon]
MLDEQVRFQLEREKPRTNFYKSLDTILSFGGAIGGCIAGYTLAKYEFDLEFWGKLFVGIPAGIIGLGIGGIAGMYLGHSIELPFLRRFHEEQNRLDSQHKSQGADTARFTYRGNHVDCVIRPEHQQTGNIFLMNINDDVVMQPTFSYQPERKRALAFKFDIKKIPALSRKIGETKEGKTATGETVKLFLATSIADLAKACQQDKTYCETLAEHVKKEKDFAVNFEFDLAHDGLSTTLFYEGENYRTLLTKFTRIASELMNKSYHFRSQFDQ